MEVSVLTVVKFVGMTLGVLAVIYIFLLLTPKIAKLIDDGAKAHNDRHPKPPEDERLYLVKSPFDGNRTVDMDKLYEQEKARREATTNGIDDTANTNNINDGDVKEHG
jgi:hypothetical protein